ncbi:MAG: SMP-30/gluconolactonase/LRE family protein [Erythrobacter sp.]|uniref:SMP-30/gluconolactonase/LRE family protein n=1 Tax=Erythrobacter sp. TaxID=1042 RepID=UPI0032650458
MVLTRRDFVIAGAATAASACANTSVALPLEQSSIVTFEPFSSEFAKVIATKVPATTLGEGYRWAEGPAWDHIRQALYFTDVPTNRAYRWSKEVGVEVFLDPSGVAPEMAGGLREAGANGLLLSRDDKLIICNHGKRAVEKLDLDEGTRESIVADFEGARFSSPNDVIEASDGTLYFTDPPYGLEGLDNSPMKETPFNGVYRYSKTAGLAPLVSDMTFPNGVALTPDERSLLIAQSDPKHPIIRKVDLQNGSQEAAWFDASPYMVGHDGLPDGLAVSTTGHVFVAGPGGVLVLTSKGECIGRIGTGRATANCTFGGDGQTLFITARDILLRVETFVRGVGRF